MNIEDVQPDDDLVITGTASSPHGQRYVDLRCTVATVSKEDRHLKVWPHQPTGFTDNGKIWFPFDQVESLRQIDI